MASRKNDPGRGFGDNTPWPTFPAGNFPRRAWSSFHRSNIVLAEFVQQTVGGNNWKLFQSDLATILANATATTAPSELEHLQKLAEYRAAIMAEAHAQSGSFIDYFCGVMSFNPASHPYTFDLLCAALKVGEFQSMYYKALFNRRRPSHMSPSLMPPLDPPGHASFPSGHATQAYLAAMCLEKVMPEHAATSGVPQMHWPLFRLAERIARNREVLGLHFPSDSDAGYMLAEKSFPLLAACPDIQDMMAKAKTEW